MTEKEIKKAHNKLVYQKYKDKIKARVKRWRKQKKLKNL